MKRFEWGTNQITDRKRSITRINDDDDDDDIIPNKNDNNKKNKLSDVNVPNLTPIRGNPFEDMDQNKNIFSNGNHIYFYSGVNTNSILALQKK